MCVCVHAHAHMAHNGHIRVSLHANMCACMRRRAHLAKQRSHSMHPCATLLMQTCVCRRRQANASCVCRNMHCHAHLAAAGKKIRRFAAFVNLQAQNTTPLCTVRNKHMAPTHKKLRPPPVQKHTKPRLSAAAKGAAVQRIGGLLPHEMRSPAAYVLHVRTPHPQTHTKPRLSAAAKGAAVQRIGGLLPHVMRSPAAYI